MISIIALTAMLTAAGDFASRPQPAKALVMAIVAHPDDEPAGLLACYGGGLGLPVIWVQMTSGDAWGGTNFKGTRAQCGAMRENECLNAARGYGLPQPPVFCRYMDGFGWKRDRLAENFTAWGGKESVLRRVVGLIRAHRPEIVFSHATNGECKHNNHIACSVIAREAVIAAADPARFRDLPGRPWQVKKLYLRDWGWNRWHPMEGRFPGLGGRTVSEAATAGYRSHVSQGMGSARAGAGIKGGLWSSTVGADEDADILQNLDLAPWKPRTIYGTVTLPDGQVAPAGGLRCRIWVVNEAGQPWHIVVRIQPGKKSAWFHLLRGMETGKRYKVGVQRELPGRPQKNFWHPDGMRSEQDAGRVVLGSQGTRIGLVVAGE